MLNRLAALLVSVAALVAVSVILSPNASSRLTILPTDDTAGGGAGNIPFPMHFGGTSGGWPAATVCLRSTGGGNYVTCTDLDEKHSQPYDGQVFIRKLVCAPTKDHTIWDGTGTPSLSLSVLETQGGSGTLSYTSNQIGGAITFDATDEPGVAKTLAINASTTIANGMLKVGITDSVEAGGAPSNQDTGFSCTLSGYE